MHMYPKWKWFTGNVFRLILLLKNVKALTKKSILQLQKINVSVIYIFPYDLLVLIIYSPFYRYLAGFCLLETAVMAFTNSSLTLH